MGSRTGDRTAGNRTDRRKGKGSFYAAMAGLFLAMLLLASPMCMTAFASGRSSTGTKEEEGSLTIEVVGEMSIDDQIIIEDEMVPQAMFSEKPADAGPRHAVLMGCVLLGVLGYTAFFDRYDEKLFLLRREAALSQKRAMEARK